MNALSLPYWAVRTLLQGFDVGMLALGIAIALLAMRPASATAIAAVLGCGVVAAALAVWILGFSGKRYELGTKADIMNSVAIAAITSAVTALVATLAGMPIQQSAKLACIALLVPVVMSAAVKSAFVLLRGRRPLRGPLPPVLPWRRSGGLSGSRVSEYGYDVEPADEEHSGGPRVLVLSLTPVTDEPRVRRQCDALWQAGWNVTVVGFESHSPKPPCWQLLRLRRAHRSSGSSQAPSSLEPLLEPILARNASPRILGILARLEPVIWLVRLAQSLWRGSSGLAADLYYWNGTSYADVYDVLRQARTSGALGYCELVVAHDWFTAPVCSRFSREEGSAVAIDCHEYSSGQYMHNPQWVKYERPVVMALEARYLPRMDAVTTVCDGIAELLETQYRLAARPTVIRSVARYQQVPENQGNNPLEIVYSGLVDPIRGLEELIHGVALANREFQLVMRGPVTAGYDAHLIDLAEQLGIAERMRIEPPVPFSEIVLACSRSDIGYFVHEDLSPQKRFVLPNKFFEYIMAGLALCVSDLPEMARIVREHSLGVLVSRYDREAIAESLQSLTPEAVQRHRAMARTAAKELCWERESTRMLDLYGRLVRREQQFDAPSPPVGVK